MALKLTQWAPYKTESSDMVVGPIVSGSAYVGKYIRL